MPLHPSRIVAGLVVAASGLAACDFTSALDIETPEYVPGVVVRGFLVADSVAVIRLGESWDPYEGRPVNRNFREETPAAVVTLAREGLPADVLTLRSEACEDYSRPPDPTTGFPYTYECGPYVGTVPVEAGATYVLRVEAEGFAPAEATVTVPRRPEVAVTEEAVGTDQPRRLQIRLRDPLGAGDLYGLSLLSIARTGRGTICENSVCRDTVFVFENPSRGRLQFDTSDPLLVATAREFDDDIAFASFPDDTFDGREKTFSITPSTDYFEGSTEGELIVQIAALSSDVYDAYQIEFGSGGDDNPFAEPVNLPSNVEGGYGLVGGIALAEAAVPPRD